MKLTTLILSGLLVLGSGWASTAIAHDVERGYARHDHGHHHTPHRHWRRHHHRPYRHWRRGHAKRYYRAWPPTPRHHDSWYRIYLFFGGH